MNILKQFGAYILMLRIVFTRPDRWRFFWKYSLLEIEQIGINSLPIVALMSTFMGAVIALQTASSMESPLLPDYTV
ncbi:MAG: ABC transporter permease, partial [Cryomorphaceae bacterium]|nr:ABC transporter permease [Cryomorphaceae bacterium]